MIGKPPPRSSKRKHCRSAASGSRDEPHACGHDKRCTEHANGNEPPAPHPGPHKLDQEPREELEHRPAELVEHVVVEAPHPAHWSHRLRDWGGLRELPDGRLLLASGSHDGTVRLWDAATGAPAGDPLGHTKRVSGVSFGQLPDGRLLLASSSDHGVQVRTFSDAMLPSPPVTDRVAGIQGIDMSPDSIYLATRDGLLALHPTILTHRP